jgi:hypothetical protein
VVDQFAISLAGSLAAGTQQSAEGGPAGVAPTGICHCLEEHSIGLRTPDRARRNAIRLEALRSSSELGSYASKASASWSACARISSSERGIVILSPGISLVRTWLNDHQARVVATLDHPDLDHPAVLPAPITNVMSSSIWNVRTGFRNA